MRHVRKIAGTTLGVIGYGDIGQEAARKAKAMGMKVIAQRRRPELSEGDGVADEVFGVGQVRRGKRRFSGRKRSISTSGSWIGVCTKMRTDDLQVSSHRVRWIFHPVCFHFSASILRPQKATWNE